VHYLLKYGIRQIIKKKETYKRDTKQELSMSSTLHLLVVIGEKKERKAIHNYAHLAQTKDGPGLGHSGPVETSYVSNKLQLVKFLSKVSEGKKECSRILHAGTLLKTSEIKKLATEKDLTIVVERVPNYVC